MSSRITNISAVSVNSTATTSLFVWTVWNGKDYKVPLSDLGKYIGRSAGFLSQPYTTPYAVNSGTVVTWGATPAIDDIDVWYSTGANSHIQRAQFLNDRISQVVMHYQFETFDVNWTQMSIFKNGSILVSSGTIGESRGEGRNDGGYSVSFQAMTHRVDVSSGDYFDIRCTDKLGGVSTLQINTFKCFWSIIPVKYR